MGIWLAPLYLIKLVGLLLDDTPEERKKKLEERKVEREVSEYVYQNSDMDPLDQPTDDELSR